MAHELDFCIAGCRLYFVCFDKSQKWTLPNLSVPEPQRADIGARDCPAPVVCDRIPPEQVVGSAGAVKYGYDKDGKPILTKEPKLLLNDNDAGKPEGIHLVIGRRPVAAPPRIT